MGSKIRLVALAQVKNDAWIIPRWLKRTSEYADEIVVVDDGSTDGTYDLLKACPSVTHIKRNEPGTPWNILKNRNYLYDYAKEKKFDWICETDSDDILDQRFALQRDELLSDPELGRVYFQEITLWGSNKFYRADKPDWYSRASGCPPHIVRVNEKLRWCHPLFLSWKAGLKYAIENRGFHRGRQIAIQLRLAGIQGKTIKSPLVKLHYHFENPIEAWKKHLIYAVHKTMEVKAKPKDVDSIVAKAIRRLDETGLELKPVLPEWGAL